MADAAVTGPWWVAQTRPRWESRLFEDLTALDSKGQPRYPSLVVFLPVEGIRKSYPDCRGIKRDRPDQGQSCEFCSSLPVRLFMGKWRCEECILRDAPRRTVTYDRPIFEGYLFYNGDRSPAFESQATINVLPTTEFDRRDIEDLMHVYARGPLRRSSRTDIRKGDRVRVFAGQFEGSYGTVERFGDGKVFLNMSMLGTVVEFETDPSNIELEGSFEGDRLRDRQHGRRHELRGIGR